MIRVAVFPSHGRAYIPNKAKEYLEKHKGVKHWRVLLAEYIDSLADTHSTVTEDVYCRFVGDKHATYIKVGNHLFCKDPDDSIKIITYHIQIAEVDNSKRWKIGEYDGAESIQYYEEPKCIDATINMYE